MIPMTMSPMQINTKFMNLLQPKWSRFVTTAKQANDLHRVTFDQFYAPTVVQQPPTYQPDTGLAIPTFLPRTSSNPNNQLRTSSNPRTQATIQNGQVTIQNVQGHMAKKCTVRKRMKDSEWFKEKMLLVESQEAGVVLNDEQQDFLAGSFEETNDYCDDKATVNAIFMANLSSIGSLNDDTVAPFKDGHSEEEAYLNREYYTAVKDRTDKSKITRKQSKTSKPGHENQEEYKAEASKAKALAKFHLQGPILPFLGSYLKRKERKGPNV
ncbi:hypothetical protein Tco_0137951 [Tanacetum coccineum]